MFKSIILVTGFISCYLLSQYYFNIEYISESMDSNKDMLLFSIVENYSLEKLE